MYEEGELVRPFRDHRRQEKLWLYKALPRPDVHMISIATDWPWHGDVCALVVRDDSDECKYVQLFTSRGHLGWAYRGWIERVHK
jgi:hypothetical protein